MARPAAIWQTVEILQQPATRNQQIRKVHGLSPTARAWRGAPCNRPPVTGMHPGKITGTGGRRLVGRVLIAIEGMEEGQSVSTWGNWRPEGSPLGESLARGECDMLVGALRPATRRNTSDAFV